MKDIAAGKRQEFGGKFEETESVQKTEKDKEEEDVELKETWDEAYQDHIDQLKEKKGQDY